KGNYMEYLSFSLIVALGLGSAAFASAEKMLPLNETGCIDQPLQVKRGQVFGFNSSADAGLVLSFAPVSPGVVVKDPKGKRIALEVGADGDAPENRFSFAEINQKGRYTIRFPRAGKIESLCVNAAN
ncbi:hypothetical protein, partial [Neisseria sp. P0022.S010]|uniref:hypothetical protein n=1 Tax=Neisseria sp. P0022.S010 TaxID=3436835 RepID=UPI003F7E0FA5